jgi:hypothetical protein
MATTAVGTMTAMDSTPAKAAATTATETEIAADGSFSAAPQVLSFDGLLFDFDGTIIDSTDGKP